MANLSGLKRLIAEDFPSESRELASKIGFVLNPMIDALTNAFNKQITLSDNVASQIKDIDITVTSSGTPTSSISFTADLRNRVQGIIPIKANNLTRPSVYPTGAPFLSYTENGNTITIQNVTGLTAGDKYRLRLLIV